MKQMSHLSSKNDRISISIQIMTFKLSSELQNVQVSLFYFLLNGMTDELSLEDVETLWS